MSSPVRLLLLDHYDSFVHNLARYLRRGGQTDTTVVRADQTTVSQIERAAYDGILISPGPKRPDDLGIGMEVIGELSHRTPILGVCLGHQAIAMAFGADLFQCGPVHGMATEITHDGQGVFDGCDHPLSVGRYHSLAVRRDSLPNDLAVTAETDDGVIMGLRHVERPIHGVQFHPESVLTDQGQRMIDNFVSIVRRHRSETLLGEAV